MSLVVNIRDFKELPEDVKRVDRRTTWGNPFKIGDPDASNHPMTREQVIALYREYAEAKVKDNPRWLEPLRGYRLACWCAPLPCHADVLVEMLTAKIGG